MGIRDFIVNKLGGTASDAVSEEGESLSKGDKVKISEEIKLTQDLIKNEKDKDHSDCEDCSGSDEETIEAGESTFAKLTIDWNTPLYNTSKVPKLHFIVPTSQKDWKHDACKEKPGSVQDKVSDWCFKHAPGFEKDNIGDGQTLTCSVTSLPINIMDIDAMRGTKNNVLLLPHFLWINDLQASKVDETLDAMVPDLLSGDLDNETLLAKYEQMAPSHEDAFVFICSHTTRDKRCGVTAPYMKKVFDKHLQDHGLFRDNSDLRPEGVNVQFINHVGGHKYAGNVQIYLRKTRTLIWLGRVTPRHIPTLVEHLIVPEEPNLPYPEKVRCIKKYKW
ncbi:hypothetical protein C6P44_000700 [Monosporozyma unispora]|nr:hypothetical protein C6P44_000700 [Kazachstania unispora]